MDIDYQFRLARTSDAADIGVIGPAAYAESYHHMWSDPEAYSQHLKSFGQKAIADFIARPDTETWVAHCGTEIVGFLSIVRGTPDPIDGRTDGIEVSRIYVLAPARGKGLAVKLLELAEEYARNEGANHLWLDAMRAYQKWGFSTIGETTFPEELRSEFRSMVVMRRRCA